MSLSLAAPWLLLALAALPVLWLLIRLLPPAERVERFPPVQLLLGLTGPETRPGSAPLWLVLLRLLAVVLCILGLAGPALEAGPGLDEKRPLAVLLDGGWASAPDWPARRDAVRALLGKAEQREVPVALVRLADPPPAAGGEPAYGPAAAARARLDAWAPHPWAPLRAEWAGWVATARERGAVIHWFHDGLDHGPDGALLAELAGTDSVIHHHPRALVGVGALRRTGNGAEVDILPRGVAGPLPVVEILDREGAVLAVARPDPVSPGETATVAFAMPPELLRRIARVQLPSRPSAAAVRHVGDRWQRPLVGLPGDDLESESPDLLRGSHYVRAAVAPVAELVEGSLPELVAAAVDAIILVDRAEFSPAERQALEGWVEAGGLLVRFAGSRLARWNEVGAGRQRDPLLPVRLSPGGRDLGGAMTWQREQPVAPFAADSPFAGLEVAPELLVWRQILALPDADLQGRVWAELADRTPLVTASAVGAGEVVLFHTTAGPGWSSLALTGTFHRLLERVLLRAGRSGRTGESDWWLEAGLDARGGLVPPPPGLAPVPGARLDQARPGPDAPPGLYRSGSARRASNLEVSGPLLGPEPAFPEGAAIRDLAGDDILDLGWPLLLLGLALLLADGLAALGRSGRQYRRMAGLLLILLLDAPVEAGAEIAPSPTLEITLAHVLTGDSEVDRMSAAGLAGLGQALAIRTSVRPGQPLGIRPGADDLSILTLLYWPLVRESPTLSAEAVASLNRFLSTGGLLVVDTRDGGLGSAAPQLQRLLRQLSVPALAPAGPDHVLTRSFYLIQSFPGRWQEGRVLVAREAEAYSRTDHVSPVVIGGADWAFAWAEAVSAGLDAAAGDATARQRELAVRAGINLIMYALTGNYKADQVHLPMILERLGIRE